MTGYRPLPVSDPIEATLRANWYAARGTASFARADAKLSAYLWQRTEREVAADRKRHPKAKRNQPKPEGVISNRVLP